MRILTVTVICLGLAACGGGGGDDPTIGPPANQSIGGIWEGADANGDPIVALIAEDGRFHFIDLAGQSFGTAAVANNNQVSATYTYVADFGTTFVDGSTSASCTLTGTVVERTSLNLASQCMSTAGTSTQVTAALVFNTLYHRDSSLATITGLYDDNRDVLDINSAGVLFEQDASDGCTFNGQVSVIAPAFNLYQIAFVVANCDANSDELNGTSWTGLATLDNNSSPEELFFSVVGNVTISGTAGTFALLGIAPRI